MSLTQLKTLGALAGEVSIDVSDADQNRWQSAYLIGFANKALRQLATLNVFRRTDIHVPTAGQVRFTTFAEPNLILRVLYNGAPLVPRSMEWIRDNYGDDWRTVTGTPEVFCARKDGIVVCPPPASAGTAILFTGTAAITETQGGKVDGSDYFAFDNAGTIFHFTEEDGRVSNLTAENNLWITYSYMPNDSSSSDRVPRRLEAALNAFMRYQCWVTSQDQAEVLQAETARREWAYLSDALEEKMQEDFLSAAGGGGLHADLSNVL